MPKFALMFKSLLNNKEKLFDLATTPVNENCSTVILKKLSEKLGDPGKFLIPCDFPNDAESVNQIDVIDVACEEYVQEVLRFSEIPKSGNPTPTSDPIISSSSPSFTPFEGNDFIPEEIETFLRTSNELYNLDDDYYDTEGDILYLEKLLNEDPSLNLPPVKTEDLKQVNATMIKPSIEEPPKLELKELPSHLEYVFLEETDKLPVIISKELKDEEKSTLLKMDFLDTFRFRLTHKTKKRLPSLALMERLPTDKTMEVFMDDFLIFGDSFSSCISHLDKMLKWCEDTNLVQNWEKCHFMVKEGIILGHKIFKSGIEFYRAKVDVIAKLPHPTLVKGV
nr:reverse transcriptase domain-containing protein [Tanacetum cinerariifolium]